MKSACRARQSVDLCQLLCTEQIGVLTLESQVVLLPTARMLLHRFREVQQLALADKILVPFFIPVCPALLIAAVQIGLETATAIEPGFYSIQFYFFIFCTVNSGSSYVIFIG